MLQYASEEAGITIDADGWATNVKLPGMVWNLSSFNGSHQGSIEQPGTDRICVTAHTNDGSQIDGISFNSQNTLQTWVIEAVDDGTDYKNPMGLRGGVYTQNSGMLPLVNDKFANTVHSPHLLP